jgi:hypothetical protein
VTRGCVDLAGVVVDLRDGQPRGNGSPAECRNHVNGGAHDHGASAPSSALRTPGGDGKSPPATAGDRRESHATEDRLAMHPGAQDLGERRHLGERVGAATPSPTMMTGARAARQRGPPAHGVGRRTAAGGGAGAASAVSSTASVMNPSAATEHGPGQGRQRELQRPPQATAPHRRDATS